MLYQVKTGDSLYSIAKRFSTTVDAILKANVICNPNLIFKDQLLIIPEPDIELPKAGGFPYYVVRSGDTLTCLARQFNTSVAVLAAINKIPNPNIIYANTELLIGPEIPDAQKLFLAWQEAEKNCDNLNSLQVHGTYYIGSFQWEALGNKAIPYLLSFLNSSCILTRAYAILSLGRVGLNGKVTKALKPLLNDPEISSLVKIVLRRIALNSMGQKRTRILLGDNELYTAPYLNSPHTILPNGTEVVVLQWYIPSPTGEEMPPGGLALWDYVMVLRTNLRGFLLRKGYQEISLI
ncbi:hypothetical protein ciss_08940 [Carboxydothermus islandicus]|uniref:LysM domain-containing protein n=1 Tax=Carboxydothermus islandicus TaxID=661089 RepID=A0A1L8D1I7_9THEO|nr:HEAT repeat domain-containing protein [Carboxydothermus islandicus]GAV24961.1 hypothetical protein ciss_08940 [Carboxydothermus islandicus]